MTEEPLESAPYSDLIAIPGIGPGKAQLLTGAGYPDLPSLAAANVEEIAAVHSIGPSLARKIKDYVAARTAVSKEAETAAEVSAPEVPAEETVRDIMVAITDEEFPLEEAPESEDTTEGKWLLRIKQALERIADATEALTSGPGRKRLGKKLSRQLENTIVLLENLPPVAPNDRPGQKTIAKGLARLADLFEMLVKVPGKKRQKLLALRLKNRRKKLVRATRR